MSALRRVIALLVGALLLPATADAAYLVMAVPSSNQVGAYSRPLEVERFPADTPFTVTWEYQDGVPGTDQVRLRIRHPDGVKETHTAWATISGAKRATFTLTLPRGRYALEPEGTDAKSTPLGEPIVVGAPGPLESVFWSCRTRFEVQYGIVGSTPCAPLGVAEWPPKIRTVRTVLPEGLQPFPQHGPSGPSGAAYTSGTWAQAAYLYDLAAYGKQRRNFVSLPNPTETHALSWFPTYFHASIDGTRTLQSDGFAPIARLGHVIKAIPHPQGLGFYVLLVNGRLGLLKTTGELATFAGYRTTDAEVPYYSELTVSNLQSDRDFAAERLTWHGDWAPGTSPRWRRPWGFAAHPSPAPHARGLHQFWVFNTFRHRIDYVDHRPQHAPDDPEGPGQAGMSRVTTILGQDNVPTGPCLDHPWDGTFGPEDLGAGQRWLYWVARGGTEISVIDRARVCRAKIDLKTGAALGAPEVVVESVYPLRHTEGALQKATGGEFAADGPAKVQALYPATDAEGNAGFILPNAVDLDSQGRLLITEQCAARIRRLDLETKVMTTVRTTLSKTRHCYEITMQVDREGVLGGVDWMYGGVYGVESDFACSPTGACRRIFPWTGLTPPPKELGEGRLSQTVMGLGTNYHWVYAPGNAALPCMLMAHNAHTGAFLICHRLPSQGNIDSARFERGMSAWKSRHVKDGLTYPAPALLSGPLGMAATTAPGWPELGAQGGWPEAQARSWLQDEHGMTLEQADDVLFAAKHHMKYKAINSPASPPPDPEPPPPPPPPPSRTLTVQHVGAGKGTTSPPPGASTHPQGASVSLSAAASAGHVFVGWEPAACFEPVTMTADLTCAARFEAEEIPEPPPIGNEWRSYASDAAGGAYALAWAHALWSEAAQRVLLLFGNSHNPNGNNSVRAFDPATNKWEVWLPNTKGANPAEQCTNRDVHYSLLVPNQGAQGEYWVIGGSISSAWPPGQNTCRFDVAQRKWVHIGNIASAMGGLIKDFAYENAGPGAGGWDATRNVGVLFGGARANTGQPGSLLQVIEPNPSGPEPYKFWKRDEIKTLPGRSQMSSSGVMAGGYFYIWGGAQTAGINLNDFWRLNLDTWKWEELPKGPPATYQPVLTHDTKRAALVLHGGGCSRRTWTFDLATLTWTDRSSTMTYPSAEYPRRNRLRTGVYMPAVDRHFYTGGIACDENGAPIGYPEGIRSAGYQAPGQVAPPPPPPPVRHPLTVFHAGTGTGVTSPVLGTTEHLEGSIVPLSAVPTADSTFAGWQEPGCGAESVLMDQPRGCTALFALKPMAPPADARAILDALLTDLAAALQRARQALGVP